MIDFSSQNRDNERMSETAFSLEINDRYTRMCDLRSVKGKIELQSLGSIDTAENYFETDNPLVIERQTDLLKRLHGNLRIKKRDVHVVIPDTHTFSQIVDMPLLKEKELIAAIRYQADEFIPMKVDETYLDIEILREDKQTKKQLVLIVAAPKRKVDTLFSSIQKAGLTPLTLENEMSAAGRFFSEVLGVMKEPYIVVNFGYSSTSIYLVDGSSQLIVYARTVKIGLELFVKDLKINMNWDENKILEALRKIGLGKAGTLNLGSVVLPILKELIGEIEKFKIIAQQNMNLQVKQIYFFNYDVNLRYLVQYLEAYFKIPVRTAPLAQYIVENPISQSFGADVTAYLSVISAHFR